MEAKHSFIKLPVLLIYVSWPVPVFFSYCSAYIFNQLLLSLFTSIRPQSDLHLQQWPVTLQLTLLLEQHSIDVSTAYFYLKSLKLEACSGGKWFSTMRDDSERNYSAPHIKSGLKGFFLSHSSPSSCRPTNSCNFCCSFHKKVVGATAYNYEHLTQRTGK